MTNKAFHYFSYGSNISVHLLKKKGIIPISSEVAILEGYSLKFMKRYFPLSLLGALGYVQRNQNDDVLGVVHTISLKDIFILDIFEFKYLGLYRRFKDHVKIVSSQKIIEVEIFSNFQSGEESKPSQKYLKKIEQGYFEFNFPDEWRQKLNTYSF